jgi:23S rRNA pseudouridine2605 synthase
LKPQPTTERLQKVMAAAGLGSRRALEKQIAEDKVRVNGEIAEVGRNISVGDTISFEAKSWKVVSVPVQHRTLIYNKPEGEVTSRSDPQGRPTVFDRLPRVKDGRWIAIGRLDINTTGLLLLTTDGQFAHAMMHPSSNVDREYACRIRGQASLEQIKQLKEGVELDDGPASFSDIQEAGGSGENNWYHVTIMEGRNREVRRLWKAVGLMVSRLKRVRYGAAFLPKRLLVGKCSEISAADHAILREDIGLSSTGSGLSLKQPRSASRKPAARRKPRNQRRR